MKYFSFIFCIFFGFSLYAQETKPIAEKINEFHREGTIFQQYNLFSIDPSPEKLNLYREVATDATVLKLNSENLKRLYEERPETIEFSFPYKEGEITVELFKENIFAQGFEATNQEGESLRYEPGVYYRGIAKDDPMSIVAFSFFKNEVIGVASILGTGNVVVGKAKNATDYLSYADHNLTVPNPFKCGVEELPENQQQEIPDGNHPAQKNMQTTNCVRIYYEIAYEPYLNNGSDVTATLNWITAIHNNISTLYANDNINIALSSTMIWTILDPYIYDYETNLYYFNGYRTNFYGDLAHLVNSPSTTSVAFVNSLCQGNNYAYSGVDQFYNNVPTYSWTINAMTHEMGHSMGSPHTHACEWNGNDTAIDGCGTSAGDDGCTGPIPADGGTIMSYCHLVSVGINLAKGFGVQPGTLIRNTVDSKWCLGTDCSCAETIAAVELSNITTSSASVNIIDIISTNWEYSIYEYGSSPTSWTSTTNASFNISGLLPNTYYILETGNICSSGAMVLNNIHRLFLTDGNYCGGDKFEDTGGSNGDYDDGQSLVKTFYPQVASDKVLLTFTAFDLEKDFDFMTVYDGENINAPAFANGIDLTGNTTIPGPFQATSASGAITVKFDSDGGLTKPGWEATLTCILGVKDFAPTSEISVYPNPTNSIVNIESAEPMDNLKVYDVMGRLVKEKDGVNESKATLSMQDLSPGIYFIRVSIGSYSQVLRIIKQ